MEAERTLVFTYGTLKRGFSNHPLLQELMASGDASYVGASRTAAPFPLVCGPFRVPFLLRLPGRGQRVAGELYAVSPRALARLDDLEGTSRGHYQRLPLDVHRTGEDEHEEEHEDDQEGVAALRVQAYFAHSSYADELWRRSGERGLRSYSEEAARGYVRRGDRPQGLTFLDHIRSFVSAKPCEGVAIAASS